jgi:hypothetical protein
MPAWARWSIPVLVGESREAAVPGSPAPLVGALGAGRNGRSYVSHDHDFVFGNPLHKALIPSEITRIGTMTLPW